MKVELDDKFMEAELLKEKEEIVPAIRTTKELKSYLRPNYIINDYMESHESFIEFQEFFYNLIKGCFEYKELRNYPIKFRFYETSMKWHTLPLHQFVIHLFYWSPFVEVHSIPHVEIMNEDFIMDCNHNTYKINDALNLIAQTLRDYGVKNTTINYNISNCMHNLRRISLDFSLVMGLNFDVFTFIDMYQKNPVIKEIMDYQPDEKKQPGEVEEEISHIQTKLIDTLISDRDNNIGVILRTGTGIKGKQLVEFMCTNGFNPDINGNTIAYSVKNSTLVGGLKTPADLYISGIGTRKSIIMSHKVMGKAGHFGKVFTEVARTLSLSKTVSDCHTKHLVKYTIINKKFLKKFDGKYYSLRPDGFDDLKVLNAKKDTDLIGKSIYVRSAATCGLKNHVCAKCFGLTANLNYDIADGVAAFLAEEISKVLEQNILSTKHLLTTDSEKIVFSDYFYKFFSIDTNEIVPIEIDNPNNIAIYIDPNSLSKNNDMDNGEGFNTYINDGRFYIINLKTKERFLIEEKDKKEIYLTDDSLRLMKKGKGYIYYKDLDPDTVLFTITIMNNELTKPLYQLMKLVNNDNGVEIDRNIDEISQRFIELLVAAGIDATAVAGEFIINRLIRCEDDIFERPDFTSIRMPNYRIVTISKALEKNKSVTVGLSYQFLKTPIGNEDAYTNKTEPSYLDPFFMPKISAKKYKKHVNHMRKQREERLARIKAEIREKDGKK